MRLHINGREMEVGRELAEKRLVEFLREDLNLTGAKNACDIGACGACTILIDNEPLKICMKRVKDVEGRRVLTIEGMAAPDGTCIRCNRRSWTRARSNAAFARRGWC